MKRRLHHDQLQSSKLAQSIRLMPAAGAWRGDIRVPLDWESAYARLRAAEESINAIDLRSQEEIEALVRARAKQLEALENAPSLPDAVDWVILLVADERYAFDVK